MPGGGSAIGKDLLASITGNVEPAYIIIYDYRKAAGGGVPGPGGLNVPNRAGVGKLQQNTVNKLAGLPTDSALDVAGDTAKTFRVQFNPHELQINGTNRPLMKASATEDGGVMPAHADQPHKPTIQLTVNLIFDDVNIYDSFMWEKFTGGLTAQGAKNVASFIATAMGTKWTVQPQVEAFIAALRNEFTRKIRFQWANFSFIGSLNSVNTQYTMFSTSGRPVRAKVQLRLRQEMDPATLQLWYNDFDAAFGGNSSNLVSAEQNVGSLLNLGL